MYVIMQRCHPGQTAKSRIPTIRLRREPKREIFSTTTQESLHPGTQAALQFFKSDQHNITFAHGFGVSCFMPAKLYFLSAGFTYPCWRTFFRSGRMLKYVT